MNFIKSILLVTLIGIFSLSSCKKKDDKIKNEMTDNIQSGSWRVTNFIDSGNDETNNFSGFNFTFNSSGQVTAINGSTTHTGTWSISDSNSNDDSMDDLHFNLFFNLTNNFEDLNDDWDINSQSENKIELIDVSGGNGGTDYLTFEKN